MNSGAGIQVHFKGLPNVYLTFLAAVIRALHSPTGSTPPPKQPCGDEEIYAFEEGGEDGGGEGDADGERLGDEDLARAGGAGE